VRTRSRFIQANPANFQAMHITIEISGGIALVQVTQPRSVALALAAFTISSTDVSSQLG
jgi:hypothetical protein